MTVDKDEGGSSKLPSFSGTKGSRAAEIAGAIVLTASPFLLLFGLWWLDGFVR